MLAAPAPARSTVALERYVALLRDLGGRARAAGRRYTRAYGLARASLVVGRGRRSLARRAASSAFDAVLDRLGDLAPAWDVAVPSFREMPAIVRDAIGRAAGAGPAPGDDSLAAFVADLAERDDLYFARMQQLVRCALLARSAELGSSATTSSGSRSTKPSKRIDRDIAHRRAAATRAANARAATWDMPLVVGGIPRDAWPSHCTASVAGLA